MTLGLRFCRVPVSYTHLDVYKRQVNPFRLSVALFLHPCFTVLFIPFYLIVIYYLSLIHIFTMAKAQFNTVAVTPTRYKIEVLDMGLSLIHI